MIKVSEKGIFGVKRTENLNESGEEKIESGWIKRLFDGKKSMLMLNEPKNQLQGAVLTGKTGGIKGIKMEVKG